MVCLRNICINTLHKGDDDDDDDDDDDNNNNNNNNPSPTNRTLKSVIMKWEHVLIDAAIMGDGNVITKEAEKILKYKDLTIEIQRMWKVKTRVIPVINNRGD